MATLAISPIPHKFSTTTSKRIPLGDVPNAANSPARPLASYKRSREQVEAQEKFHIDLQPRAKRQALDAAQLRLCIDPQSRASLLKEDRLVSRSTVAAHPTTFERRLLAARDLGNQQKVQRPERPQEDLVGVRKWQQHYKKAFPQFVFYFESIPEDVRLKYSKTVRNLGAREEKFFSKAVTHLVTSRSVPTQAEGRASADVPPTTLSTAPTQSRTINPSLLERTSDASSTAAHSKAKFDFDAHVRRANPTAFRDTEQQRPTTNTVDVLSKAQDLGVKIWHLSKLERIINTIFEVPNDVQYGTVAPTSRKPANVLSREGKDVELSRMLRHERLHGPSDRDVSTNLQELILFKGPHILVRDVDERTKPIMAKEWPRPTKKGEHGEWPQFRAAGHGRCPFIEEIPREEIEMEMARQEELLAQQRLSRSREASQSRQVSRAVTPLEIHEDEDAADEGQSHGLKTDLYQGPLQEFRNNVTIQKRPHHKPPVPQFCPPPARLPPQTRSPAKASEVMNTHAHPRPVGVEPAASGVQPSNITSAIRSQIISSTAAAPFVRAGTSKEVHGLKRKVLEKSVGPALNNIQNRQQPDYGSIGRAEAQICRARQARPQSREVLTQIGEESAQTEEEEDVWLAEDVRTAETAPKPGKAAEKHKRQVKPGYCENCREKYDNFDEHVLSRRHRKFALNPENWKDLDKLLSKLVRPLRSPEPEGF